MAPFITIRGKPFTSIVSSALIWVVLGGMATGVSDSSAAPANGSVLTEPMKDKSFVLATGSPKGIYYAIGRDIARIAESADTPICLRVDTTSGSIDNLIRIRNGTADFALLQSDIAHDSLQAGNTTFSILASLYTETIQICVRKSLFLTQPGELRGKKISVGLPESGTYPNAIAVLEAAGLTIDDIHPEYLSPDSSFKALKAGAIDAAFFTAGVPHSQIAKLIADGNAYLLGLDARTIKRLVEQDRNFVLSDVSSRVYAGLKKSVQTVGVRACIVCSNDRVDREAVLRLLQALYHPVNRDSIDVKDLRALGVTKGIIGVAREDFHPDAEAYYEGQRAFVIRGVLSFVQEYHPLAVLFIIPLTLIFLHRKTSLTAFIYRNAIHLEAAKILGWVFTILFLTGGSLFFFEHGVNGDFGNLWESFWSTIVYLVSGFENRVPLTAGGKAISIVGMLGGAFTGILVTVVLTARKVDKFLDRSGRHMNFDDHIVIIGWNDLGRAIVTEILNWGKTVTVLSKEDEDSIRNTLHAYATRLTVFRGDPYQSGNYDRLHLEIARSVIVLSTQVEGRDPDDVTLGIVLGLREAVAKIPRRKGRLHVVAELTDANRSGEMRCRGVDEVICTSDLRQKLLVNAAVNPGVAMFFYDLLYLSGNSNEAYAVPVPGPFWGWSYKDVCDWLVMHPRRGDPLFPMGILKSTGEYSADPQSTVVVESGDSLIVIAFDEKSLGVFDTITPEDVVPLPEPSPRWIASLDRQYRGARRIWRRITGRGPRKTELRSADAGN